MWSLVFYWFAFELWGWQQAMLENVAQIYTLLPKSQYCQKYWVTSPSPKFVPKHQWLVHSLYGQKYWDIPFFRREKCTSKLWQQRWKHNSCTKKKYFHLCCNSFEVYEMTVPICTHMSLVFGDEFLAQGLHLKSSAGIRTWLSADQKFFHTDWIIIYLWPFPYTQRHCQNRIE